LLGCSRCCCPQVENSRWATPPKRSDAFTTCRWNHVRIKILWLAPLTTTRSTHASTKHPLLVAFSSHSGTHSGTHSLTHSLVFSLCGATS
jgi:hypothetical protein